MDQNLIVLVKYLLVLVLWCNRIDRPLYMRSDVLHFDVEDGQYDLVYGNILEFSIPCFMRATFVEAWLANCYWNV